MKNTSTTQKQSTTQVALDAPVLLDARQTERYRRGHVAGALNLPPVLTDRLAPIYAPDKTKMIFVLSESDPDSAQRLAASLCALGYTSVRLVGQPPTTSGVDVLAPA